MRMTIFRSRCAAIVLAVGALMAPTFAFSQGAPGAPATRTVFYQQPRGRTEPATQDSGLARAERPTVRTGEYLAAPYIDREGGPRGAGQILSSAEVSAFPVASVARTMMLADRVLIRPPQSAPSATKGDRYLSFALGPSLYGYGQVVIPTGVLVVERSLAGAPVEARVIAAFEAVSSGQRLIPLGALPSLKLPRPAPASRGATAQVLWVSGAPALATLQSYVVIGAGTTSGLASGDQITLERSAASPSPGTPIARAVVVRVMPRSATALVIEQTQAEIQPGVLVRVTAKMP